MFPDPTITSPNLPPTGVPGSPVSPIGKSPVDNPSAENNVKQWNNRIKAAKKKFDKDIKRMKKNMEFASGLQWAGQASIEFDKYINNITLRNVNQKVSTLYARDPQAVPHRRERMDYQLWDGKMESLQQAMMAMQQSQAMGLPAPPEATALLLDYQQGQQTHQMLDKIGETLKVVYHYQMEDQEPEFKEQLKQCVAYAVTCGVAFARMSFVRDYSTPVGSDAVTTDVQDKIKRIQGLTARFAEDGNDDSSPVLDQIKMLANSLISGIQGGELQDLSEKLIWDFPTSTSIIVDPACRSLMGFIGAKWIAQEYVLPLNEVNDYFELRGDDAIKVEGDGANSYNENGESSKPEDGLDGKTDETQVPMVCLWEVFNLRDKTSFFIVDGWKKYVQAPQPPTPKIKRFWPIFALTFNRIVTEPGTNASIYPPSDVDLIKSPQKEWNRSRQELREHRKANAPMYAVSKNVLTDDDKANIRAAESNSIIELGNVPPGTNPNTVIQRIIPAPIDEALYDTEPLSQDIMLGAGAQQANLGPPDDNATATGSTIAEQSRLTTSSSNVDDLDGFLTRMARAGGEMLLREMSPDTVKKIAGIGAVWPSTNAEQFIDLLYLETQAASSGRPNKAIDVANWQRLAPLMQAAGANPQYLVRETIKRLDDQADPSEAFPLVPMQPTQQPPPNQPPTQNGGPQPQQSVQPTPGVA